MYLAMNVDWQNAIVLLAIAAAGGYLARRAWQSMVRRKAASCGGCGSCTANTPAEEPHVIGIAPLSRDRESVAHANGSPIEP
jgi:hypothetical protein